MSGWRICKPHAVEASEYECPLPGGDIVRVRAIGGDKWWCGLVLGGTLYSASHPPLEKAVDQLISRTEAALQSLRSLRERMGVTT